MENNEKTNPIAYLLSIEQNEKLNLWIEASNAYYNEGEDIMSDVSFDELTQELIAFDVPELTDFVQKTLQTVSGLEVVNDNHEMVSLKKIKWESRGTVSEILKFLGRGKKLKYGAKFDGGAVKIKWNLEKKEIISIQTRGGLDITFLLQNNPTIIKTLEYNKPLITGEIVINKKTYLAKYADEYENPRVVVTSMVKNHKNTNWDLATNDIKFVACTDGKNPINDRIWKEIDAKELYNLEEFIKFFKSEEFPYLCDGIVLAYHEEGERQLKDNYPLNMVAIKFPGARCTTKVIGFKYTQKKSGRLTPMLLVEPTKLDGITVSIASGYNHQNIIDKQIGIGSIVEIEKSNDIIPVVAKVITRSKEIIMPDCEYVQRGKFLYALDMAESKKFKFYSALRSLQIDGIGETLAYQIGEVVDFNIFELFNTAHKPQICACLNGGVTWKKFSEFYNIKTLTLDKLIYMMQFNQVGDVISRKIALLIAKKSTDTTNIPGDVLVNVCRGEGFKKIVDTMNFLKTYGVNVISPIEINDDTITFEMTGTPPGMTKQEFVAKFKTICHSSIHETLKKDTKYLFCDDITSNSGKINKARKYNIKVITYTDALLGKL